MIIARNVLGGGKNGTGHCCQSHTLMTVYPVTATAHAVDTVTEAALGPRTTPYLAPL